MSLLKFAGIVAASLIVLAACSSDSKPSGSLALERSPQESTVRAVEQGDVIGTFGAEQSLAWYGVPFAQAPIGDLRWRAPRLAAPWKGRYEATRPDKRCTQYAPPYEPEHEDWSFLGEEDCLYLNIWAPADQSKEPLPVMVWIHGGAGVWGHAGQYEMGQFANRTNTIVVAINYRLAMMGWFAHPAIAETAETDLDRSANFAILDQIAALEWIQRNIEVFGGDNENITVFGQSAGGFHISALLSSPLSEGLFHKAIIQSGGFNSLALEDLANSNDVPGTTPQEFLQALEKQHPDFVPQDGSELSLANALRDLPAELIFEIYKAMPKEREMPGLIDPVGSVSDGISIPDIGVRGALTSGHLKDIPLMIGTTRDEIKGMSFFDRDLVGSLFGVVFWPKDKNVYEAVSYYPDTAWAGYGVREPAEVWETTYTSPAFTYRFDWDEQGKAFTTDIGFLVGASHASEIAFVIDGFDQPVTDYMGVSWKKHNAPGRKALSSKMISYWGAFAHNGSPGKGMEGDLPDWKAVAPGDTSLMLLDSDKDGGVRMAEPVPTATELFDQFLADTRLKSMEQRCKSALPLLEVVGTVGGDIESWTRFADENC
ncbi:carboxylesterase family protein [Hyphomonas sp.]|uniref:carboxylesterase/lipase family protein n=1 Tax=Hyphomonas sp. TaxID=87 RepID=UPI000DF9F69F|nr:carboxylesterase family protein [Hyphomonas sp.]RCL85918.1 MAG: hypothetical protein DBW63_11330 [Hyphomonas sp.]